MTWMLYELSRHIESQARILEEISYIRAQYGYDVSLTTGHYDSMRYFNAVIKVSTVITHVIFPANAFTQETLRLHPILPILVREANCEDVIPLSVPVKDRFGRSQIHISVSKGQRIVMPLNAYNRYTQV